MLKNFNSCRRFFILQGALDIIIIIIMVVDECDIFAFQTEISLNFVFCRESQFDTIYVKTTDNRRLREAAKVGEENLQICLEDLN